MEIHSCIIFSSKLFDYKYNNTNWLVSFLGLAHQLLIKCSLTLFKSLIVKKLGFITVAEIENRNMERFDLELKAYLSVTDMSEQQKSFELLTSNICAGGAFFKTNAPLRVGTDVRLDIILPLNKFKNVKSKISRIYFSGSVIRTNQQGMAICFDKNYKILPLKNGKN